MDFIDSINSIDSIDSINSIDSIDSIDCIDCVVEKGDFYLTVIGRDTKPITRARLQQAKGQPR